MPTVWSRNWDTLLWRHDGSIDPDATTGKLRGPLSRAGRTARPHRPHFIGRVTRRFTHCATPGCRCHADPPQPHGPYYQWTAKIDGKTVTRRLSAEEAKLYKEWIDNDRKMRRLIAQMRQVAAKAGEIRLAQTAQG